MKSFIERTMIECRKRGWIAHRDLVTEVMTIRKKRRDLLGVIDLLVFTPRDSFGRGPDCIGLQVTSSDHHAGRRAKAMANEHLHWWLASGNRFEIWSWRKKGNTWIVREQPITFDPSTKSLRAERERV